MKTPALSRTWPMASALNYASASTSVCPKRCAIYTRKSSEEGLDQEYNSLQAQADAARSYIASQRHDGWIALDDGYDDGAYSGGNLQRPALQRLLADIEAGRIDIVVVYKIDRLTRSIFDFALLAETFERCGVSIVAVTQHFSTATSMGRLTLHMLLSFSQYEREITKERIRDKIAASKAKGMWMGGVPPLGYDVRERKLIINPDEAALVRDIFVRYAEHGSAAQLVRELEVQGRTTKSWINQAGQHKAGRPIDQQYLFTLLRNRLYLGEMTHKGHSYPGQHEAIISTELWQAAHRLIEQRKVGPRERNTGHPALLAGILYAADGQRMLPTYTTKKGGKRYRYYVPYLHKRRCAPDQANAQGHLGPLPAAEIEAAVLQQIHQMLQTPQMMLAVWRAAQQLDEPDQMDEAQAVLALRQVAQVWQKLFPAEQQRIARLLIERVQILATGLEIAWKPMSAQDLNGLGLSTGTTIGAHPLVAEFAQMDEHKLNKGL